MQMPKPTDTDKARFRDLVPDDPRIEVKPMFGNLGAFVNGNMFMGLFGAGHRAQARRRPTPMSSEVVEGAGPFGPAERPMGGYVTIPPTMVGHRRRQILGRHGPSTTSRRFRRRPPAKASKAAMSSQSAKR